MSSPAPRRSQRNSQSATPSRSLRSSQPPRSSPAPAEASSQNGSKNGTPRQARASQLASSPMFFQSSPANGNGSAAGAPSSPLRQMSNTQSTDTHAAPSSPLRHMTDTQSVSNGDRTPRASGGLIGGKASLSALLPRLDVLTQRQSLHPSAMSPAPAPEEVSASHLI